MQTLWQYLQDRYTPGTAKIYGLEIGNYLSNRPEAAIAVYKDIVDYIGALRFRYHNASTLNRILASIKAYYDYLCATGQRSDHPARAIKLRDQRCHDIQLQELFSTTELESLLDRTERYPALTHRNSVLISLLVYQALLPAELEALMLSAIDLHRGTVYIKATSATNQRTLFLNPNQVLLFYEYIHQARPKLLQKKRCNALLIGLRGQPMQAPDIVKHIRRTYKGRYPHRPVTAQTIRQSVIAGLFKQGYDLSLVQAFAGHKYPSSTERYKQSQVDTLKAAVLQFHPLQ